MKYTIEGFDQQAALEARKDIKQEDGSIKTVKLDCVDLIILRWIVDYFPDMRKTTIDGEIYGWIRYDKVLEEFPLLDIKKRMLITRLSKMVDLDILTHRTVKTNDGVFSYYGFGKEYAKLIRNAENDPCNKLHTPMQNIADPYAINCTPLCKILHIIILLPIILLPVILLPVMREGKRKSVLSVRVLRTLKRIAENYRSASMQSSLSITMTLTAGWSERQL